MSEFNTIEDMLNYHYRDQQLIGVGKQEFEKALTTASTARFNTIYGPKAFSQLNQETNLFGMLPKFTSKNKGYRAYTTRPSNIKNGVAEGGNLAVADDDTWAAVTVGDKTQQITYQYSEILALRQGKDDIMDIDEVRRLYMIYHIEGLESSLNTDGDTLAGNNMESIDRVTASAALATAMSWTAADEDIYGIDRSANSWADAQVSHNTGTDRDLTLGLIREILYKCKEQGARTNLIMTGYDTYNALINLLDTKQRFTEMIVNVGAKGIQPAAPAQSGTAVLSFDGVPVMPNPRTLKDTISRMYFLDSTDTDGVGVPRLGIRLLRPPTNIETNDFFKTGAFAIKGNFSTVGELYCRALHKQGSLRDLK